MMQFYNGKHFKSTHETHYAFEYTFHIPATIALWKSVAEIIL